MIRSITRLWNTNRRLLEVIAVMLAYQLDRKLIKHRFLFRLLRLVFFLHPKLRHIKAPQQRGECLRLAMQELGPIYVKFGQILSLQTDKFPPDIIEALEHLQDRVKPFEAELAIQQITTSLGAGIDELFKSFESTPLAAASVAQVHRAELLDGQQVVVKVLRPNIRKQLKRDIALLYHLARWTHHLWKDGRRLQPEKLVAEFDRCIEHELNLLYEAASANQLRYHFSGTDELYIPRIYWPYVRKDVLVLEYIDAIPVSQVDIISAQGTNLHALAKMGVKIFLQQVFDHCFFHADMHPGNIFVAKRQKPQYIAVDFGIMGSLSSEDQYYLAANLLAFFKRDYRKVAELHIHSGWVSKQTNVLEFESMIRTLSEPVFARPLVDISLANVLLQLFQTAGKFNMEIQPQLLLLQKTLISVEAIGKRLDPRLNLWQTAMPQLETWMNRQFSMRMMASKLWRRLPLWLDRLPELLERLIHQA